MVLITVAECIQQLPHAAPDLQTRVSCSTQTWCRDRGVYPHLPMAQLSHDQFWQSIFKKWKFNFENNLRVKQQFSPQMSNYTQQTFRLGTVWGQTGGLPRPSLRTFPGWENCAYVVRGDRRPGPGPRPCPSLPFTFRCSEEPENAFRMRGPEIRAAQCGRTVSTLLNPAVPSRVCSEFDAMAGQAFTLPPELFARC